jgi:hypothetical protein
LGAYSACVGRWSLNSIKPLSRKMANAINVHDAMCGNQESCSRGTQWTWIGQSYF